MKRSSAVLLLFVLLLGGCGGSSSGNGAGKQITVPGSGGFPAITIPVTTGAPALCRREAQVFSRAAVSFLVPFPSDADVYRELARLQFLEFKAHRCDVAVLRTTLSRRTTARQRRVIVASFLFLGETARELETP